MLNDLKMSTAMAISKCSQTFKINRLKLHNWSVWRTLSQFYKDSDPKSDDPRDPEVAKQNEKPHPETQLKSHPDLLSPEPVKGKPYDKIPFRIELKSGKTYHFCTCGYSKSQPFCDGSHKAPFQMSTKPIHIKYRPMKFTVDETKEYWLCQCKQSNNRPFCDGTHKRQDIQDAVRS